MAGADGPRSGDRSEHLQRRRAEAARAARVRRRRVLIVLAAAAVAGVFAGLLVAGGNDGGDGGDAQPVAAAPAKTTPERPAKTSPAATTPAEQTAVDVDQLRAKDDWPLRGERARGARVPILMYHLVGEPKGQVAYPDLWVTPANFQAQVSALAKAGFTGVTMDEVWDAWHGDGALPARAVVLSFDDGDISQVMNAAPVLKEAGWPGVLNLTLNHLGNDGLPRWGVKRMLRQGWELGSHTLDHPDMTTLDPGALRRQLVDSRKQIEAEFDAEVDFFCYPAGRHDQTVRDAVDAADYTGATTTEPGLAVRSDDPFALPRVRVQAGTSAAQLVELARG